MAFQTLGSIDEFRQQLSEVTPDRYDAALAEDIPFLEQQQVGLSSKFARPGRFSNLEPSVANFAYWYAEKLAAALE